MSNKDLNYIAGLEKAIKQKYGEEAVQNPSSNWTPEKEKEYLQQLKENKVKELAADRVEEREGFLFSAKLIKKDSKNVVMYAQIFQNSRTCCTKQNTNAVGTVMYNM